jgi:hypothetical protein
MLDSINDREVIVSPEYLIIYIFIEYCLERAPVRCKWEREIEDVTIYYNFFNEKIGSNFIFKSSLFSGSDSSFIVKFKDSIRVVATEKNLLLKNKEIPISNERINFDYVSEKSKKTKRLCLLNKVCRKFEHKNVKNIHLKENKYKNFCLIKTAKCKDCKSICAFSQNEINNLKIADITRELKNHFHPKSRMINKRVRNIEQSKKELFEHYRTIHNHF